MSSTLPKIKTSVFHCPRASQYLRCSTTFPVELISSSWGGKERNGQTSFRLILYAEPQRGRRLANNIQFILCSLQHDAQRRPPGASSDSLEKNAKTFEAKLHHYNLDHSIVRVHVRIMQTSLLACAPARTFQLATLIRELNIM